MAIMIRNALLMTLAIWTMSSCQQSGPEPIAFGKDQCHFCRMTIANPQYGAELITDKGRVFKYDAAECLINQLNEEEINYRQLYAIAYDQPKKLLPVDTLAFVISESYKSPMGANLAGFLAETKEPNAMKWEELVARLSQ